MAEQKIPDFLMKDFSLEQRLKGIGLFPGSEEEKRKTAIEFIPLSALPFFEKLYFLKELIADESYFQKQVSDIFRSMTLGEIVSEIVKPELIDLGLENYPDIDFRLVFSD
jgi:hypothetical protein